VNNPYQIGQEFGDLFARYEHALKRSGFLKQDRKDAQANWVAFAAALGEEFFGEVRRGKLAETLIGQPPARLMREGLKWAPPDPPLEDCIALFERGICRVRNSLVHGEKFVGDPSQLSREVLLVSEALSVLKAARCKIPSVAKLIDP